LALRFFPMLTCLRVRRFQVFRVFEAMTDGLVPGAPPAVKPQLIG
jgi:hypothetical protein